MSESLAVLELLNFDGSEVFESDIRKDNLHKLYWRTAQGEMICVCDLKESHLRNIALMLMGFGYREFYKPDRTKVLWLSALRLEWERRKPFAPRELHRWLLTENGKLVKR